MQNIDFIKEYYQNQVDAYTAFINDAYPSLPNGDFSTIRFGGGTALAIYYFQHRLSFDIDLFVTDAQIINYLSPKHWLEESKVFNAHSYVDLSNHIRVLYLKNNIKVDVLVAQDFISNPLIDDSKDLFPQTIYVESIDDIIAKKIIYRRQDNLTRDIIDIAISITHGDNTLKRLVENGAVTQQDIDELVMSLNDLDRGVYEEELEIVNPFKEYREISKKAPELIIDICSKLTM